MSRTGGYAFSGLFFAALLLLAVILTVPVSAPLAAGTGGSIPWTEVNRDIGAALATARERSLAKARLDLDVTLNRISARVDHDFIPWYTSFTRRKIEELVAYNNFASDKVYTFFTGETRDTTTPPLIATFEEQFNERVLRPPETVEALRVLARGVTTEYAETVSSEFRRIEARFTIPPEIWAAHLKGLPPVSFVGGNGQPVLISLDQLATPGPAPMWREMERVLASRLVGRFERLPSILGPRMTPGADEERMFSVGRDVGVYFASYVVYWIFLLFLIQSGVIPLSLFSALLGWILWEAMAWGTWIGYEAIGFEQTRVRLGMAIEAHANTFFTYANVFLGDYGQNGPFKALYHLEETLRLL
ncbi:MAG: hypothetical protein ABT940_01025 [Alphaproteobacteria bacterium]